jgi:hypothetical protein
VTGSTVPILNPAAALNSPPTWPRRGGRVNLKDAWLHSGFCAEISEDGRTTPQSRPYRGCHRLHANGDSEKRVIPERTKSYAT